MEMHPHDRPRVTLVDVVLVQTCLRPRAVVPICLIHVAFFSTNPERRRFVVREVERRDRNLARLVVSGVNELQRFLRCILCQSVIGRRMRRMTIYLGLCEHVYEPTAYRAIGTTRD